MRALVGTLCSLWSDRKGATAVEYGLIVALVVLALIVGLSGLGTTTTQMWSNIHVKVRDAG